METASEKRERILREAEEDAFGPSKKKPEQSKPAEAKKPTLGDRFTRAVGATGSSVAAGAVSAFQGVKGAGDTMTKGMDKITGNGPSDLKPSTELDKALLPFVQRIEGGADIVKGLIGLASTPIAAASGFGQEYGKQAHGDAVALPGGPGSVANLIRMTIGNEDVKGTPRENEPMTVSELAGHIAAAAVIAKGAKTEKPKSGAKPKPQDARAAARTEAEAKLAKQPSVAPQGNENFTGAPVTPEGVKYRATAEGWEPETPKAPEAAAEGQQSGNSPPADYADAMHAETIKPEGFGGATFDPRTGAAPADYGTKFVAANTKGGATVTPVAEFTPDVLRKFAADHAPELAEPNAFHGTWTKDGNVYQDVSRRVPTQDEAMQIARGADEKQQALWDEANNAEIPVPDEAAPVAAPEVAPEPSPEAPGAAESASEAPASAEVAPPAPERPRGATAAMAAAEGQGRMLPEVDPELARAASPYTEVGGNELKPGMEPAGVDLNGEQPATAPQVQTMQDAAQAVEPGVAAYGPPSAGDYLRIRDQANTMAQEMRAQGASRRKVQDAYRQYLNDNGILSQTQAKEISKRAVEEGHTEPLPTPSSEDLKPEHVNGDNLSEQVAELKVRAEALFNQLNKLLGTGGDSTLGGGVPIRIDLSQLAATGEAGRAFMNQAVSVGAAIIAQGAKSLKAYVARIKEELGDRFAPDVLKAMYEKSKAELKTLQDTHPEMLTPEGARQAFTRGRKGMYWYDKAPEELAERYGPENVHMAADVYAATSINTDAGTTNPSIADRAIKMILSGERDGFDKPFTMADRLHQQNVLDKLNGIARGEELTGPKIGPYASTLKGIPKGVDAMGNAVFEPVLDSWMGRGFKFAAPEERWSPSNKQRDYVTKVIVDIANTEGVTPYQVQAAMWVEFKRSIEQDRVRAKAFFPSDTDPFGNTPGNEFRPGWDHERLQKEFDKINQAETPFDQLLQNRLGPVIRAAVATGDTSPGAGERLLSAKVIKALAEPGALADPDGAAMTALQSAGLDHGTASGVVPKIWQSVKDRLNSTDPEGAKFSKVGMGIDPFDLFRLFHKDGELQGVPFDAEAARASRDTVKSAVPNVDEALRADLRDTVTDAQATSIKDTRDAAMKNLSVVMDKDQWEPGELHAAAVTAGALAEKARNADARVGQARSRRGPNAVKPVNEAAMDHFSESMHEAMSEPELYGKLKSLDADGQQRWLANMFEASDHPARFSLEGLAKLWQGLYYNEALSGMTTFGKSLAAHASSVPWIVGRTWLAEQVGKVLKNEGRVMPGQTEQLWSTLHQGLMEHWRGIAAGDLEGLKLTLEQEGDLHLTGGNNPQTMLDNILNIGSAPSVALGTIRSPIKNALRRASLAAESWRRVSVEALADEKLQDPAAFQKRLEDLRRNPDEDLLKYAHDYADQWSFTKSYDDMLRGGIQSVGKTGAANTFLLDPFVKLGTNVMSIGAEMNPVTAFVVPEFRKLSADQKIASLAMGSALVITGMGLAQQGFIDGPGPRDASAQKQWQAAGHYPNSVRNPVTGKPMFSTKYLGLFGPLLTTGAAMNDVWSGWDDHARQESVIAMALATSQSITGQGVLDTYSHIVTAIANGINDNGEALMKYLRDKIEAGTLVFPNHIGLVRDIESAIGPGGSPLTMSKDDNKHLVSQTWDLITQEFNWNLTGWSEGQPMIRNPLDGNVIPRVGPSGVRKVDPNPVAAMIDKLGSSQAGLSANIVAPKRSVGGSMASRTGPGADASASSPIPLSAWQYDRKLQLAAETTIAGKTLMESMQAAIDSSPFQKHLEMEEKNANARREGWCATKLKEIYQDYEKRGEDLLVKEDKHLSWEIAKKQWDAEQLQSLRPREFPKDEPEETQYPRPGQNTRK